MNNMKKRFKKIYIEITNKCNLNCSFCSKGIHPKREMTCQEFENVLLKIKDYTESIYLHIKGEPLLHSQFDDILSVCDKYDMKVKITTNGTLLNKNLNILLKHRISQINVSLHSENNMKDYFNNVFNSCDILSKKMTIIYRIWTLPTLDLTKISTEIVDKIILHYHLDETKKYDLKTKKNIKIEDNIYVDKDYEFIWPKEGNNENAHGTCLGTRNHIGILSNGDIVPCCLDCDGIIKLGNIFSDNLDEALNSIKFKEINEGFIKHQVVNSLCKNCSYRLRFK